MKKLLLVLLVGLICEAIGVVLLRKGLVRLGPLAPWTLEHWGGLLKSGATSGYLWLGLLFEALFFAGLLFLMAKAEVSFVWPLTSLGFVLTTLAAQFVLGEKVSWVRWCGVVLIVGGAALITWSERVHEPVRAQVTVTTR